MNIKLANWETIEPITYFYVILANFLVVVPCGAEKAGVDSQTANFFLRLFFVKFYKAKEKWKKIFRI